MCVCVCTYVNVCIFLLLPFQCFKTILEGNPKTLSGEPPTTIKPQQICTVHVRNLDTSYRFLRNSILKYLIFSEYQISNNKQTMRDIIQKIE